MSFTCPSCSSDNIQKLSIIYEDGLSDINTKSSGRGVGIGRGGIALGMGSSKTKGTSQSAASKRAAPPPKQKYVKPLFAIFVIFFIGLIFCDHNKPLTSLVTVVWLIASVGWCVFAYKYNSTTWPPLKATWDRSFLCNRCHAVFALPLDRGAT